MIFGTYQIIHLSIEAIICIFGLISNGFVILIFILDEKLRRKKLNIYLLSLAVIDLIHSCPGIILAVMVNKALLILN